MPYKNIEDQRECARRTRERVKQRRLEDPEFDAECRRKARIKSAKQRKKESHKAFMKEYQAKWYQENKERTRERRNEINRNWRKKNPEFPNKWNRKRYADKVSASLLDGDEWNDFFIDEIYSLRKIRSLETGFVWHVDHIVPLKGKIVSGLHVWYNLQLLPASVNLSKNNSFDEQSLIV